MLEAIKQGIKQIKKGKKMEFIEEIKSTLKEEKSNLFDRHQDQPKLEGWIEALEYVIHIYNKRKVTK